MMKVGLKVSQKTAAQAKRAGKYCLSGLGTFGVSALAAKTGFIPTEILLNRQNLKNFNSYRKMKINTICDCLGKKSQILKGAVEAFTNPMLLLIKFLC
jgi:hypothetical protein